MPGKMDKYKDIVKGFLRPTGKSLAAGEAAEDYMEGRRKKLKRLTGKKSGGMLDVIYGAKKGREDMMREME